MSPLRAIKDANSSLQSHQLAFMAGMQAALASVLKRLDPHAIEHEHNSRSLMGSLLDSAHKARLWDHYIEHHAAVVKDAETDFHGLFGHEFLGAYQNRVTTLREQAESSHGMYRL
jgi:predicted component of type VI protein secretion system